MPPAVLFVGVMLMAVILLAIPDGGLKEKRANDAKCRELVEQVHAGELPLAQYMSTRCLARWLDEKEK